jgi:ABC-type polysaccharide/polyol phosphate export permease
MTPILADALGTFFYTALVSLVAFGAGWFVHGKYGHRFK